MSFEMGQLSRRSVLKGLGVTMCLPLLEAMEPLAALATDSAKQQTSSPGTVGRALYAQWGKPWYLDAYRLRQQLYAVHCPFTA